MQVRIGNKQDEQSCRDLVKSCLLEQGGIFDLQSTEADLKNIEQSYLGRDGIFVVCEEEQQVLAFAAAARGNSDDECHLARLYVAESFRGRGIGGKLVAQVVFFARNLDYRTLLAVVPKMKGDGRDMFSSPANFLAKMNFRLQSENAETVCYERILTQWPQ